jgi:hypothetical protein
MNRWLTEDEQQAWRGLLRMTAQLNARMNRQLQDDYGISLADYDVLVVLSEAPQARMQRRGLVARQECPTDARGAFVVLTEAGRAAIERAAPAHVEMVRQLVFDGLSRDQLSALTAVSDRVLDRLQGADDDMAGPEPAAYDN